MKDFERYLSVSDINAIIKSKLENDYSLKNLTVKGEISNYKEYDRAVYFSLKEDNVSSIPCVMWKDPMKYKSFKPQNGDEVLVKGSVSVYTGRGYYQLTVYDIELFGQGQELLRLLALKKKLEEEGLFDPSKKKMIPRYPFEIGVIVGAGSAAEADIKTNIKRRWPVANLHIFNALVQGKDAPKSIIKELNLSKDYPLDVLIIARGGGSSEDLSAFNDELLVREIYAYNVPVIAAVGHEIDFTLVDFVADKRVSTPTGAAEAATPDIKDVYQRIYESENRLDNSITDLLEHSKKMIESFASRQFFKNPASIYEKTIINLTNSKKMLDTCIANLLNRIRDRIDSYESRLASLNPYSILNRGYSMAYNKNGKIISSINDVNINDIFEIKVADGTIEGEIKNKKGK